MIFWKLFCISLRSQMQYPASFLMLSVSCFLGTFVDIFGIWVLFDRFKIVKGWSLPEVALLYGIVQMGFSLAETFSKGFDHFDQMIKHGNFDRLLLRPISPLLQVAVQEIHIIRLGRLVQGFLILVWSSGQLHLPLFSMHSLIILSAILGAAYLFYGLFVLQAAFAFWATESLKIMNIATYGGLQTGQYPLSIYSKPIRLIFTFLIPVACVGYYPVAILLRHESIPLWVGAFFPFAGNLFLYLACRVWYLGVRHYHSTGS